MHYSVGGILLNLRLQCLKKKVKINRQNYYYWEKLIRQPKEVTILRLRNRFLKFKNTKFKITLSYSYINQKKKFIVVTGKACGPTASANGK